jgi:hypothetical protein
MWQNQDLPLGPSSDNSLLLDCIMHQNILVPTMTDSEAGAVQPIASKSWRIKEK